MEVADSIVVMASGEVQQAGTPDELYDKPASDFVMGFLGPVTHLRGRLVRPHDLDILVEPAAGTQPGRVRRVVRLGFEVRIEVLVDGAEVWAQLTREDAGRLALEPGDLVHVRRGEPGLIGTKV